MCLIHAQNSHSAWHCFQGAPQRTIELSIGNTKVTMRAIDPTWKDLLNTLVTKQKTPAQVKSMPMLGNGENILSRGYKNARGWRGGLETREVALREKE